MDMNDTRKCFVKIRIERPFDVESQYKWTKLEKKCFLPIPLQTLPLHLHFVLDLYAYHSSNFVSTLSSATSAFALRQTFYFRTSNKFITLNFVYFCLAILPAEKRRGIFKFTYVKSNIFLYKIHPTTYWETYTLVICIRILHDTDLPYSVCCHPIGVYNVRGTFCTLFRLMWLVCDIQNVFCS